MIGDACRCAHESATNGWDALIMCTLILALFVLPVCLYAAWEWRNR